MCKNTDKTTTLVDKNVTASLLESVDSSVLGCHSYCVRVFKIFIQQVPL